MDLTPLPLPTRRPRRLRRTEGLRRLTRETRLSPDQLVYPLFVREGAVDPEPIGAMPGVYRWTVDQLPRECESLLQLGIPGVILFGIPAHKASDAPEAYREDGVVQEAVRRIKAATPDLVVITDVCLCEYTDHGHCGLLHGPPERQEVDNDPTLELLARTAVSHAAAGADVVAPSDMMDGRVAAIRQALDSSGFGQTPILSYAAKYASGFYGPFREAAGSTPQFGDRRGYQMDPSNLREALKEVLLDLEEGADMVMVKPALAYLDVIRAVREMTDLPLAAYNVSGEYSMLMAAAERGWIDGERVMMETLTAIARAGADFILTYHAKAAAALLQRQ